MAINIVPEWMANLEDEDISFIKKFILASGSLKEIAKQYDVTYPTVRLRLDMLIQKIQISEDVESEPYVSLVKRLALNDKIDFETAKILVSEYKKEKGVEWYEKHFNYYDDSFTYLVAIDILASIFIKAKKQISWFNSSVTKFYIFFDCFRKLYSA